MWGTYSGLPNLFPSWGYTQDVPYPYKVRVRRTVDEVRDRVHEPPVAILFTTRLRKQSEFYTAVYKRFAFVV